MAEMTGAQVVAKVMKEENVDFWAGIVAGGIFEILKATDKEGIRMLHMRDEQTGVYLADAWGRVSGKPGVCFGGAHYGLLNMVGGLWHTYVCRSPVVAITSSRATTGGVGETRLVGDHDEICKHFTKWSYRILDWRTISYYLHKAFKDAVAYPPGPVLIEVPGNIQSQKLDERAQMANMPDSRAAEFGKPAGDPAMIEKAVRLLLQAEKPLIVGGEDIYWSGAIDELLEFVELMRIPVFTTRLARGAVPEDHPLAYRGGYSRAMSRQTDAAIAIGLYIGGMGDNFGQPPTYNPQGKYILVNQNADELGARIPTEVRIQGSPKTVLKQMLDCAKELKKSIKEPPTRAKWLEDLTVAKEAYRKGQKEQKEQLRNAKPINPHFLAHEIVDFLDPSAYIVEDSLDLSQFTSAKIVARFAGHVLDAGGSHTVGHSIGMAMGAQLARPGKQVLGLIGDGGFGISGMDMETAVRYSLPVVFVLLNNHGWTSPETQKPWYNYRLGLPISDSFAMLPEIRYDKMFEEMGCHGEWVTEPEQIRPALERSFNSGKPSIVNVVPDLNVFPPFVMGSGSGLGSI